MTPDRPSNRRQVWRWAPFVATSGLFVGKKPRRHDVLACGSTKKAVRSGVDRGARQGLLVEVVGACSIASITAVMSRWVTTCGNIKPSDGAHHFDQ
jgi:hypothetical protein